MELGIEFSFGLGVAISAVLTAHWEVFAISSFTNMDCVWCEVALLRAWRITFIQTREGFRVKLRLAQE